MTPKMETDVAISYQQPTAANPACFRGVRVHASGPKSKRERFGD